VECGRGGAARLAVESGGLATIEGDLRVGGRSIVDLRGGQIDTETLRMQPASVLRYRNGKLRVNGHAQLRGKVIVSPDAPHHLATDTPIRIVEFRSCEGTLTIESPAGITCELIHADDGIDLVMHGQDSL
jgi:hypothetical protein